MIDKIAEKYEGKIPALLIENAKKECKNVKLTKVQMEKVFDSLLEKYEYAKIQAGEAIGIITAESFGEPGTQMCVAKDEKVLLKIAGKIQVMKIGEFVDGVFQKVQTKMINGYEIYSNIPEKIEVLSMGKDEKLVWSNLLALNRVRAPEQLLQIKTRSGRSVTATDYHSFVTRQNNKVVSVAGKDLTVGNRIPAMRYLPEHCTECISVTEYTKRKEKDGMVVGNRPSAKPIPAKLELNESFGWFIGAYLAEGNVSEGQVNISNTDDNFIANAREFITKIGLDFKEEWHHRGFAESRDFKVNATLLAELLRKTCKTGSYNKTVPQFAYSAKEEFVKGLLRGYFDGDGNITVDRKMIRSSSGSEELIRGISILLNRFGIFSRISQDNKDQWWLVIPYKYAELFQSSIGFDILHKKEALAELVAVARQEKAYTLDQVEMISGFDNLFYDVAKKLGMHTRYVNNFTKRQKIGRSTLERYMNKFEQLAEEKQIDINAELKIMQQMLEADIIWDEITSIEYVDYKHKYVYDLSVPGNKTFTTFNGLVVHNTLRTFHLAGVTEVNVTLGLPRLIEIFDARKLPSTPLMLIYLNKPYNKEEKHLERIIAKIKEIKVHEVLSEVSINLLKLHIEFVFNKKRLRDLGIVEAEAFRIIKDGMKTIDFSEKDGRYIAAVKNKDSSPGLPALYTIKEKLKQIKIKGVKGVTEVVPKRENNEIMLFASGANLDEVYKIPEVDYTKSISNHIFEIRKVLGVEAARQIIIEEASKVIQEQGLDIDIRHIMFIADLMTHRGEVKGVTRSGITAHKESVLARASFETPIKHLINASLRGVVDSLNSVVENVMINQPIPLGTGLPKLITKLSGEKKKKKKKEDKG